MIATGQIMAYAAGCLGWSHNSGWLLVGGSLLAFLGVVTEGMSAYTAGRRDRDGEEE